MEPLPNILEIDKKVDFLIDKYPDIVNAINSNSNLINNMTDVALWFKIATIGFLLCAITLIIIIFIKFRIHIHITKRKG